jgi:hypothetical protein
VHDRSVVRSRTARRMHIRPVGRSRTAREDAPRTCHAVLDSAEGAPQTCRAVSDGAERAPQTCCADPARFGRRPAVDAGSCRRPLTPALSLRERGLVRSFSPRMRTATVFRGGSRSAERQPQTQPRPGSIVARQKCPAPTDYHSLPLRPLRLCGSFPFRRVSFTRPPGEGARALVLTRHEHRDAVPGSRSAERQPHPPPRTRLHRPSAAARTVCPPLLTAADRSW